MFKVSKANVCLEKLHLKLEPYLTRPVSWKLPSQLTLKQLGHFLFKILFYFVIFHYEYHMFVWNWGGWVGLWGFLWWAPSAKGKDHHGVSSGWSSVWHRSNTGLSSTQYEQIPIILGVWPFWLTPFFFRSITFGGLMVKLYFLCWNYSLSSGWHIIAA